MPQLLFRPRTTAHLLLLLSMLLGGIIAISSHTEWQAPVESAQVQAGLVTYPPDNPIIYFHLKSSWSLLNHLAAVILRLGGTDLFASLLLEGVVGAVSFGGLFLAVHAICRKPLIALFTPLFVNGLSLTGAAISYPIILMGTSHSYGIMGLSYMLLTIGFLGSGYYRTGAFLAGMAPAIHPSMGTFCTVTSLLAVLVNLREVRGDVPKLLGGFILGLAATCASLAWQFHLAAGLPQLDLPAKRAYLEAYIRNFDAHRIGGSWLTPGGIFAVATAIIARCATRLENAPPGAKLFLSSIYLSVIVTLVATTASEFFSSLYFLKLLIPWRFTNYANLALYPVCLGLLAAGFPRAPRLRSLCLVSALVACYAWDFLQLPHPLIRFIAIIMVLLVIVAVRLPDLPERPFAGLHRLQTIMVSAVLVIVVCWQVLPPAFELPETIGAFRASSYPDIARTASARPGLLLTAGDMHLVQLMTRRPVLLDGGAIDNLPYVLDAAPRFNEILQKVYGLDIFRPPATGHNIGMLTYDHRQLWEGRSRDEWRQIRQEFNVTDIFTPDSWRLQLPVASSGAGLILYTIP